MKGLEIAKAYYQEYGLPLLSNEFPDVFPLVAVGVFGSGSECFGFDDDISRDHDFDPGFMVLLPDEDKVDRTRAFQLERAYAKLPAEFKGIQRPRMTPVGGPRRGVLRASEVFQSMTGSPTGQLSTREWLTIPQHALAEVVNGQLFYDGLGQVTQVRARLAHYPDDVRRKKLAGHLLLAAQAGQYNYARCLQHGEPAAAQLAVITFSTSVMEILFLLNKVYQPFYKWQFRALRGLPVLSLTAELLEYLITTHNEDALAREKQQVIEDIAHDIVEELQRQQLSDATGYLLEDHAYAVNNGIAQAELRNEHVLAGV